MDEERIIEQRKQKFVKFAKEKFHWIAYIILAAIVWISLYIRTRNLPGLRDVTTGGWTLGPDLDPFLFLRWAKYIVENGTLFVVDMMRYVPLGFNTRQELILLPYMIAWFHKITFAIGLTSSVEHSAVLFPVFMFGLTVIAFFFMTKAIFEDFIDKRAAIIIALISSFFIGIFPQLLPRTIAGIPEKESVAFLFLFLGIWFFISAWKAKKMPASIIYSLLAGSATALMALVWGGYIYLVIAVAFSVFLAFLLGQINIQRYLSYTLWFFSYFIIAVVASQRTSAFDLLTSLNTVIAPITFVIIGIDLILFKTKARKFIEKIKIANKIPRPIFSTIFAFIILIIAASLFLGPTFVIDKAIALKNIFINPTTDRINVTVAENKQPYFTEWAATFGPIWQNIPISFYLFFFGSIYLFWLMAKKIDVKNRLMLTGSYTIFLLGFIFSRYNESGLLNGENFLSILLLVCSFLLFVLVAGSYYIKIYKKDETHILREISFAAIILLVLFLLSVLSSRSAIRLIMVLVPSASILIGFLIVGLFKDYRTSVKGSSMKTFWGICFILALLFSAYSAHALYKASISTAESYVPSVYTQQWQKAMDWTRDNTDKNAVFSHWWDYGYWVQSIGERATMVDGGNAIGYWNYLVGRYALTGSNDKEALEVLYAHNISYFLIDSSDIGKYAAFASIGSNENYDRRSWINTFVIDATQTAETKNKVAYLYRGGFSLDEDIIYEVNQTRIFLPGLNERDPAKIGNIAGLGAIRIEFANSTPEQPQGIFVYQNKQYSIPIRYLYTEEKAIDFGSGIEAGVFIMPAIAQAQTGVQIVDNGALLFLSKRTVNTQFSRYYLQGTESDAFRIAHVEEDFVVEQLRSQGIDIGSFVYYNGVRGPIKIWKVNYNPGVEFKPEYIERDYPDKNLTA